MPTFSLDSFSGGRDLRPGQFSSKEARNRFRELINFFVTKGGKIKRRPPKKTASGALTNAQGLIALNGQLYTLARNEDTVINTLGVPVNVLRFNRPDYTTDTVWELMQLRVYNGNIAAIIRHEYPGVSLTERFRLHIFDSSVTKPTYIEDPWCPTNWAPNLPLFLYGSGAAGLETDVSGPADTYVPRMGEAGGHLWVSGPDGNAHRCKAGDARVWNEQERDDLLSEGEWFYFFPPTGQGTDIEFRVSMPFDQLNDERAWSGYVLEYMIVDPDNHTGTWQQMTEDTDTPTVHAHYQVAARTSRWTGSPDETQLVIHWDSTSEAIFRFRIMAGDPATTMLTTPTVTIDHWGYVTWTAFTYQYQDQDSVEVDASTGYMHLDGNNLTASLGYVLAGHVTGSQSPESTLAVATQVNGVNGIVVDAGEFVTGQARENGYILKKAVIPQTTLHIISNKVYSSGNTKVDLDVAVTSGDYVIIEGIRYRAGSTGTSAVIIKNSANASGNYTGDITNGNTLVNYGSGVSSSTYKYGNLTNDESEFYLDKFGTYEAMAGFGKAGFDNTSAKDNSGKYIMALDGVKSHLAVIYNGSLQVWDVDPSIINDRHIDTIQVGMGAHTINPLALFNKSLVGLFSRGIRAISVSSQAGSNSDSANDTNIGEPIEEFRFDEMVGCCSWAWTGEYVAAMSNGSSTTFHVFDYSKESKISAWSKWTAAGLGVIDRASLCHLNERLYFLIDGTLNYFDAEESTYRDDSDEVGQYAYQSTAEFHQNDFDKPLAGKKYTGMSVVMEGRATVRFKLLTNGSEAEIIGPTLNGTSIGRANVGLAMRARSLAPIITSVDETGCEIQAIAIEFAYGRH